MEVVKLYNPKDGGDIKAQFVAREDEIRKKNPETGVEEVTNAKDVTFPRDSYVEVDRKTADWILRTWRFVEEVGSKNVEPRPSDGADEPVKQEAPKPVDGESLEDEFEDLKNIGYQKLDGTERKRYKELKEHLGK